MLIEATDPALVKLELDVFWVAVTGANPLALRSTDCVVAEMKRGNV